MEREKLPDVRSGDVHKFTVGETKGYIRTGCYPDGRLGEVFINMDKSEDAGTWSCIGILISMALQRGVKLRTIVRKLSYTRFSPSGVTSNKTIKPHVGNLRMATSLMDYIVRWLWLEYGDGTDFRDCEAEPVNPDEDFVI